MSEALTRKQLYDDAKEFYEATEGLLNWMNGNDLSSAHRESQPDVYERLCEALLKLRITLESEAALSRSAGPELGTCRYGQTPHAKDSRVKECGPCVDWKPLEPCSAPDREATLRYDWTPAVEEYSKLLVDKYADRCSMEQIVNAAYALGGKLAESPSESAPLTPFGEAEYLLRRISEYRSGYSCGYSDAKNGARMRDKDAAELFFASQIKGGTIPDVESTPAPEGGDERLFPLLKEICRNAFACAYQQNIFPGETDPCGKCANCLADKVLGENWEKEKLPAPEGMGRDAKSFEEWFKHRPVRGYSSESLAKEVWDYLAAHPTSESGTEDSRPYPDATVMRSRLQLLSFLITGNDYAFFSANPAIQESLKCYSERVIEDWQAKAESGRVEEQWIAVESKLPPRHQNVLCLNRDGNIFEGRICAGMHKPFFTYPRGDGNPSNTAPSWIDVTHWMSLPKVPASQSQPSEVRK